MVVEIAFGIVLGGILLISLLIVSAVLFLQMEQREQVLVGFGLFFAAAFGWGYFIWQAWFSYLTVRDCKKKFDFVCEKAEKRPTFLVDFFKKL